MTEKKIRVSLVLNKKLWQKFKQKCVNENKKYSHKIEELIKWTGKKFGLQLFVVEQYLE